jgi:predicted ATPase
MLRSLKLNNFRCFRDHEIQFSPLNIAVGLNNAGKSTLAEALRIVSIASSRLRNGNYREPPDWLTIPRSMTGMSFSLQNLQINFDSLFYRYGDPPASIKADFGDRGMLRIYVAGAAKTHCVVYDGAGRIVRTKEAARRSKIPRLDTLPQVGPVAAEEHILTPDYVQGALSSRLAPIHFRNQLNLLYEEFPKFQQAVEETWPGLKVVELIHHGKEPGKVLHLEIRDGDFVGEIATMGHGVQMWLQTIWFLTRVHAAETVILDEPDVYMHADLQRKLIRYVRNRFPQVIVTTHSTEIMSEVAPEEILVIDKSNSESRRADSLPAVQRILTALGSAQNVHLARLWCARRFLLVEGDDLRILQVFQNVLFPSSAAPIAAIPSSTFGGWGGWRYALGSSIALKNAGGSEIIAYCLLDRDYHTEDQVSHVYAEFANHGGQVHVWSVKEIENFLLHPAVIVRAIESRLPRRAAPPAENELKQKLDEFAAELQEDLLDGVAQEILSANRALGAGGANRTARTVIRERIERVGLIGCVSGKAVLQKLCGWIQVEFGVSLSAVAVARNFRVDEVDTELGAILGSIEHISSFPQAA